MDDETKNAEKGAIETLLAMEDLAEKKLNIFSRLLMEATVAKKMEELAKRNENRKEKLACLLGKKQQKKQATAQGGSEE